MIDYLSHVSALRTYLSALASAPPPDPAHPQAVATALTDAGSQPGSAMLGALTDHLLQYSQAETSVEIDILQSAAALFEQGLGIYDQLSTVRSSMEAGLTDPTAPGALAAYNVALENIFVIQANVQNLRNKIETFQANFSGTWMAPVGQQVDTPVPQWAWRDVFLARRTTAFVANAQGLATTARQRAFAIGALAGAVGNLLGSGYLNSVVGGPRRSHQLRHRLAAYSTGAWLRDNEPQTAGTLSDIRTALSFGQTGIPALPSDLKTLIENSLEETYPSETAPLPDLHTGYSNLLKHLTLLDDFTLPPVPPPVNNTLTNRIAAFNWGTLWWPNNNPAGAGGSNFGTKFPRIGAHENGWDVCETILVWMIWPFSWVVALDEMGGGHGASSRRTSQQGLQTASQSATGLQAFGTVYSLQMSAWQAIAAARTALVLQGLLYPDPDDLSNPTYSQFVEIPANSQYPLLSMPSSDNGTSPPTSALEQPGTSPPPYPVSASPIAFLTGHPTYSVSALAPTLWVDFIEHPGTAHRSKKWPGSGNFNLDCDRGFQALCWKLAPGSTITSQPVNIVTLNFNAI